MVSFIEGAANSIRQAACGLLADDGNALGLLRQTGLAGTGAVLAAGAARRLICNNPDSADPGDDPFAQGGQCLVAYNVRATYKITLAGNPTTPDGDVVLNNILGPIGYPVIFTSGPVSEIRFTSGSGLIQLGNQNNESIRISEILTFTKTRVDGLPDDCGNSDGPPVLPLPFIDVDVDITYDNSNNEEVTENDWGLTIFAPVAIAPGAFAFPITLSLGGLNLTGNLNFDGTLDLGPTFNIGTGQGGEPPDDEEPEEPEPDQRLIIGCRVFSSVVGSTRVGAIAGNSNPDIYIPRLGSVQFLQPIASGQSWSPDQDIKTLNAWIPCPPPGYATRVGGVFNPGVQGTIVPVYGRPEIVESET